MSDNAQMMKLYSARILALAADIPHLGRLDAPQTSVEAALAALWFDRDGRSGYARRPCHPFSRKM